MKPAQVIVLCEDKQHSVFVYRFLKRRTNHRIRVVSAPASEGSAEQFVREQYPRELKALRLRLPGDSSIDTGMEWA